MIRDRRNKQAKHISKLDDSPSTSHLLFHRKCGTCQASQGSAKKRAFQGKVFRAASFGQIVFVDFKEIAAVLFLNFMDCLSRTVTAIEVQDHSSESASGALRLWLAEGMTGGELFCDEAPAFGTEEFKAAAAESDYIVRQSPAPYYPEWVSPLERFHQAVNVFRRKKSADDDVRKWLPDCIRQFNQGESYLKGVSRISLKVGTSSLASRAPLHRLALTCLDAKAEAESDDRLELKTGDRVKVSQAVRNKGERPFRIGKVLNSSSATALVLFEDGDTKEVSRRLIADVIPDNEPTPERAQVGDVIVFASRKGPALGVILKVTRYSVEYQSLQALDRKKSLRKRQFIPLWFAEEGKQVTARVPPEGAAPVGGQIPWQKIEAFGKLAGRDVLPPALQQAFKRLKH